MKRLLMAARLLAALQVFGQAGALAGPWEDGMAAYNRGDYVPAIQLVRPLAQQGNAKAQALLGGMYRRGKGVAKSSAHAFMWLSMASARGNARARAELRDVSRSMSPEELAHAREMMRACEVSNYRNCEY
jgi:TPR repeat protein